MANLQRIREIAEKKSIMLSTLAEQVGISAPGMSTILKKNSTTIDTLEKIARVLDVPISTFFDDDLSVRSFVNTGINESPNATQYNGSIDSAVYEAKLQAKEVENAALRSEIETLKDTVSILKSILQRQ